MGGRRRVTTQNLSTISSSVGCRRQGLIGKGPPGDVPPQFRRSGSRSPSRPRARRSLPEDGKPFKGKKMAGTDGAVRPRRTWKSSRLRKSLIRRRSLQGRSLLVAEETRLPDGVPMPARTADGGEEGAGGAEEMRRADSTITRRLVPAMKEIGADEVFGSKSGKTSCMTPHGQLVSLRGAGRVRTRPRTSERNRRHDGEAVPSEGHRPSPRRLQLRAPQFRGGSTVFGPTFAIMAFRLPKSSQAGDAVGAFEKAAKGQADRARQGEARCAEDERPAR